MSRNKRSQNKSMTPMQKQALLVCIVCAVAVLLTVGVTASLLKRGTQPGQSEAASSSEPAQEEASSADDFSDYYQIDQTSGALLAQTADAGDDYLQQTLFLGDSNTVRLYTNGLISLQQFCAKEGLGTRAALSEGVVTFKKDDNYYTLAQAVAMMKPRRVVITLGTNDTDMAVSDFVSSYTALIQAIQEAYPYTDIIVNTVPPIPENHSTYPGMDQHKIDDFNMALLSMCEQLGLRFLNSAEALKGEDGYGREDYYTIGDIHLKSSGLKALLNYVSTHAYETEDRRPDTNNIPTRTLEYSSKPSSAVEDNVSVYSGKSKYEARYRVDKSGGGTLSSGETSGKTTITCNVSDSSQKVTVTAVPASGYVFVKWSDGVTTRTRTDTGFKQNLDVTAVFGEASVSISCHGSGFFGAFYTFEATLKGKYADEASLHWYANGSEVYEAAGQQYVTVLVDSSVREGTYKVYATISYNDSTVKSNTLVVTMGGVEEASSGSSSASSGSSSGAESSGASSADAASSDSAAASSSSSDAESSSDAPSEEKTAENDSDEEKSASSGSSSAASSEQSSSAAENNSAAASGEAA